MTTYIVFWIATKIQGDLGVLVSGPFVSRNLAEDAMEAMPWPTLGYLAVVEQVIHVKE